MEHNRNSYLWDESEILYGIDTILIFCLVATVFLISIGIGAMIFPITSNNPVAYLVAITFQFIVSFALYNLLINKEGYRLTDVEPPVGTAQKLTFIFLSILIPPLFFVYIFTWVKRRFWRKHSSPLYTEIRKARKLLRKILKQPNTSNREKALAEAKKTYLYLLNLESSDTDINLMFIDKARKQRETIELATILRAESLSELDAIDRTVPKQSVDLD